MAPANLRGTLNVLFQLMVTIGVPLARDGDNDVVPLLTGSFLMLSRRVATADSVFS
jgi:hypothetical protein